MNDDAVRWRLADEGIVSRETLERLEIYASQVEKWNPRINLIAKNSLDELWFRHFYDGLQIVPMVNAPTTWLDVGSGGGFPALVLATHFTDTDFTLVESDQRKSAFLRQTARLMDLPRVTIIDERIEDIETRPFDVISARALADLSQLLDWLARFGNENSEFIFPKGKNWQIELTKADENWQYNYDSVTSKTSHEARILRMTKVKRK